MTFVAVFAVMSIVLQAIPVGAHGQLGDSVDTSTTPAEIRYTSSAKYTTAVNSAISRWNALPGGVRIRPDTYYTYNDLHIKDVFSSDDWAGYWRWQGGQDIIKLNRRYLDRSSWELCHDHKVVLHELGHAHGIGHNSLAWSKTIMRQGKNCASDVRSHDKVDYENKWG